MSSWETIAAKCSLSSSFSLRKASVSKTSFLFSLTNNFKHTWRTGNNYLYGNHNHGPTWGSGYDFNTGQNHYFNSSPYCKLGTTYNCRVGSPGSSTCYNDFCGAYQHNITELEVFLKEGA